MSIFKHRSEEIIIEPPSLGSYPNFTRKEIFTQGEVIKGIVNTYVKGDKILLDYLKLKADKIKRVYLVGSGIGYSVALFGAYNFEVLLDVTSVAELASEFLYSNPILDKSTLVVLIGEDLKIQRRLEQTPAKCVRILEGGDRKLDISLNYTELGELPTISYTSALIGVSLLSLYLGEKAQVIDKACVHTVLDSLKVLDEKIKSVTDKEYLISQISKHLSYDDMLLVGTNVDLSVAIYGSKILSQAKGVYIDYSSLDEAVEYPQNTSIVALASSIDFYSLLDNDLNYQLKITSSGVKVIDEKTIFYNESLPIFNPILSAILLQIIAYKTMNLENKE